MRIVPTMYYLLFTHTDRHFKHIYKHGNVSLEMYRILMMIIPCTLKPQYNEQVIQTLFVHYIEYFTISNVIFLVNLQNGSWLLFTISRNSLYRGSLYRGLSVYLCTNSPIYGNCHHIHQRSCDISVKEEGKQPAK